MAQKIRKKQLFSQFSPTAGLVKPAPVPPKIPCSTVPNIPRSVKRNSSQLKYTTINNRTWLIGLQRCRGLFSQNSFSSTKNTKKYRPQRI